VGQLSIRNLISDDARQNSGAGEQPAPAQSQKAEVSYIGSLSVVEKKMARMKKVKASVEHEKCESQRADVRPITDGPRDHNSILRSVKIWHQSEEGRGGRIFQLGVASYRDRPPEAYDYINSTGFREAQKGKGK